MFGFTLQFIILKGFSIFSMSYNRHLSLIPKHSSPQADKQKTNSPTWSGLHLVCCDRLPGSLCGIHSVSPPESPLGFTLPGLQACSTVLPLAREGPGYVRPTWVAAMAMARSNALLRNQHKSHAAEVAVPSQWLSG